MTAKNNKFIQIDEEGFFHLNGQRLLDEKYCQQLLEKMQLAEFGIIFIDDPEHGRIFVEAFDAPLVVKQLHKKNSDNWSLLTPYGFQTDFKLQSMSLDEWDRFHGLDVRGIPFVLSRSAQADFFNLVDDFDDDSITVDNIQYSLPNWLEDFSENKSDFWEGRYRQDETHWDLGEPHSALKDSLAQIKLNRSRILVLGCGKAHDAHHLAQQGHFVTAVDYSEQALAQAKQHYPESKNLQYVQANALTPPNEFKENFDVIFEHTLYCAINPSLRTDLVKVWRQCLVPTGQILGVFFATEKRTGPPFGGSEWEIRQRLKNHFDFLYWTRWKNSSQGRMGSELVVFAQKKEGR